MRILLALTAAASVPLTAVHFPPRPGWHVGSDRSEACAGVSPARCSQVSSWASTVPWLDCAGCLPHRTTDALPANGIAIQITLSNERPPSWVPRVVWPPRIRSRDVVAGFEGLQRRIGVYQRLVRVGRVEAYVWAFFGRDRPTHAQLRAANAELSAARLPR